ncbi:hypothetical protein [Bradyrhizobium sp. sBnM-33]|uniref:hypothetical protein n=1 Tax=Bradyrhizobium sp. sBnM-33 TaxID=2831780 RepID=UPI001BD0ED13|nr:hypothetical protein [Bradyrhizobium sp. sBnM-33]WOH49522.1 hypothetical protein RX328_36520 [Bradyrhizobium sp. sBnM-33]
MPRISLSRLDRAPAVPFGRQGTGRQIAYAAPLPISNESSYAGAHSLLRDAGRAAGTARSSSTQAEWLGDCENWRQCPTLPYHD